MQTTNDFIGTVEYSTGLTCSITTSFQLQRPSHLPWRFSVKTPMVPVMISCCVKGKRSNWAAHNSPSGLSADYLWQQAVDNGFGFTFLQPLANVNDEEAYLDAVAAEAPLDATTLLEGFVTATYTYSGAPGFECVVQSLGRSK